jgi:hypothetical protein
MRQIEWDEGDAVGEKRVGEDRLCRFRVTLFLTVREREQGQQ